MFRKVLENELENIDNWIKKIESQGFVEQDGVLLLEPRGTKNYCYWQSGSRNERTKKYLGKPTDAAVREFAMNKARAKRLDILNMDKAVIEKALKQYKDHNLDSVLKTMGRSYQSILHDRTAKDRIESWKNAQYRKNSHKVVNPSITNDGTIVKSKGECLIYNTLDAENIPFQYDPVIKLIDENGNAVQKSPDFKIACVDYSFIYMEHAGMLLDDDYRYDFVEKLKLYLLNGIVPGDNLFITSDTKTGGINAYAISRLIRYVIKPRALGLV